MDRSNANVSAGNHNDWRCNQGESVNDGRPEGGTKGQITQNSSMNRMASQNGGTAKNSAEKAVPRESTTRLGCSAERMPSGSAINTESC